MYRFKIKYLGFKNSFQSLVLKSLILNPKSEVERSN